MKAIVAVDKLWGIGSNGDLLFHIKEDMKFFKLVTTDRVVVMGRKTFESLPNKEPLKNRINLVITSDKSYNSYDNVIFGTMDEIREEIKKYDSNNIFIIGGASIYSQFIHECDTVYVTHNTAVHKEADTYMSNLAFEGFKIKQTIYEGKVDDDSWRITEWVACNTFRLNPYKSVLWYNDANNNTVFAYYNTNEYWSDVYNNNFIKLDDRIKNCIPFKRILKFNKMITVTKINKYYKAEINISNSNGYLRLASYGDTKNNAWLNLIVTIMNIVKA